MRQTFTNHVFGDGKHRVSWWLLDAPRKNAWGKQRQGPTDPLSGYGSKVGQALIGYEDLSMRDTPVGVDPEPVPTVRARFGRGLCSGLPARRGAAPRNDISFDISFPTPAAKMRRFE